MGALLSYSIASSLTLLALYIAYKWALASERQHSFNRIAALSIYAISLLTPIVAPMLTLTGGTSEGFIVPDTATQRIIGTTEGQQSAMLFATLLWIWLAGAAVMTAMSAVAFARMFSVINRGSHRRIPGGYILVTIAGKSPTPFSWHRYIVMSEDDYKESADTIMIHELCHLRNRHWLDLLLAQVMIILQWYNPAAWLLREELKNLHEYQADCAVLRAGTDIRHYQTLLIKKAVGARFPSLANSLNHSKLKKRVTMMYKSNSSVMRKLRAAALLPALALAVSVIQSPALASVLESTSLAKISGSDTKVNENPATLKTTNPSKPENNTNETIATFPGGETALYQFLADNIKYPAEAEKKKIEGRVAVQFVISTTGKVSDIKVTRSVDPLLDAEAVRVASMLPDFNPATKNGIPVATEYILPVSFKLK